MISNLKSSETNTWVFSGTISVDKGIRLIESLPPWSLQPREETGQNKNKTKQN